MTLADEDTNSILTDNANRAFQGNAAMRVTQLGGQLWNQAMQVTSPDDQILNHLNPVGPFFQGKIDSPIFFQPQEGRHS